MYENVYRSQLRQVIAQKVSFVFKICPGVKDTIYLPAWLVKEIFFDMKGNWEDANQIIIDNLS